jgi:hypothetical protein
MFVFVYVHELSAGVLMAMDRMLEVLPPGASKGTGMQCILYVDGLNADWAWDNTQSHLLIHA